MRCMRHQVGREWFDNLPNARPSKNLYESWTMDKFMKTTLTTIALLAFTLASQAVTFFVPGSTNPAPVVQLAWTPSPDPTVIGYNIYYGAASGQYDHILTVGNQTNASITLPARGVTFFFAATATTGSLESVPSNEVNYTPAPLPGAPGMKPPVKIVAQSRPLDPGAQWADVFNFSISPDAPNQELRLMIASAAPQVSSQVKALAALRATIQRPPAPGQ